MLISFSVNVYPDPVYRSLQERLMRRGTGTTFCKSHALELLFSMGYLPALRLLSCILSEQVRGEIEMISQATGCIQPYVVSYTHPDQVLHNCLGRQAERQTTGRQTDRRTDKTNRHRQIGRVRLVNADWLIN